MTDTSQIDSMHHEVSVPALGVEERSDEAPSAAATTDPGPGGCGSSRSVASSPQSIGCGFGGGGSRTQLERSTAEFRRRSVVQLASEGLAHGRARCGSGRKKRGFETAVDLPLDARCIHRGASGSPGARVGAHTILDVPRKPAGIELGSQQRNALLIAVHTACGAGRRGAACQHWACHGRPSHRRR